MRDAEQAVGIEATEANFAWLSDVHGRLAALEHLPASTDSQGGGRSLEQAIAEAPVRKQLR
jgi:DNA primase